MGEPEYSIARSTVSSGPWALSKVTVSLPLAVVNLQGTGLRLGRFRDLAHLELGRQSSSTRVRYGCSGLRGVGDGAADFLFLGASVSSALTCLTSTYRIRSSCRGVPGLAKGRRLGADRAPDWGFWAPAGKLNRLATSKKQTLERRVGLGMIIPEFVEDAGHESVSKEWG